MDESETQLRAQVKAVAGDNVSVEKSQKSYIQWADTYDKDVLTNGYSSHIAVCKKLCDVVPPQKRSSTRVLDVGAGTGLVARQLRENGFTNIDGLDPSQAMLDQAKNDKLYQQYIVDYITGSALDISANSYDAITGSGIFVESAHVPNEAIIEMIRLVKPGGVIVLISRCNVLVTGGSHEKLEPLMNKLVNEKKWELVSRETWEKYYMTSDAIVWCFRVSDVM
ncbi:ubiE/COQ5 methyltransferase [Mactra antiquata]